MAMENECLKSSKIAINGTCALTRKLISDDNFTGFYLFLRSYMVRNKSIKTFTGIIELFDD
jgi:hypothetical protein